MAEYIAWITELNKRLNGDGAIAASQLDIIQHARTLTKIPEPIIAAGWHKQAYKLAPRIRYRATEGAAWVNRHLTDLELGEFELSEHGDAMTFWARSDDFAVQFRFGLGGGALFAQVGEGIVEVMAGYDDWVDLASWLTLHPPVFYAADKTSFQGANLIGAAAITISKLSEGNAAAFDWNGCAIGVEFDTTKSGGLLTVHQKLQREIAATPGLRALVYDHRSGEAADYIAVVQEPDGLVRVRLYHCKGAGGEPSGGRVGDVYEVAGQMLKSVAYCDAPILTTHIEHRVKAGRHTHPSSFVVGDLDTLKAVIDGAPATGLRFEIYGVQPGISLAAVDEHLADLMAYGLDYVQRGGAAQASWMISA